MARIGEVEVTILSEDINRTNEVTDRKVEDGSISDNVKSMPDVINLTGVVGSNGWESLQKLIEYKKKGEFIKYRGRNAYDNVVIEALDTDHSYKVQGGFTFSCTLKQIIITKAKMVQLNVTVNVKPQVKQVTNAGRQLPKKKAYTNEVKIIDKFGTTLEKW